MTNVETVMDSFNNSLIEGTAFALSPDNDLTVWYCLLSLTTGDVSVGRATSDFDDIEALTDGMSTVATVPVAAVNTLASFGTYVSGNTGGNGTQTLVLAKPDTMRGDEVLVLIAAPWNSGIQWMWLRMPAPIITGANIGLSLSPLRYYADWDSDLPDLDTAIEATR